MNRIRAALWAALVLTLGGAAGLAATSGNYVEAADHLDPPARVDPGGGGTDRAADIADVYAWHSGSGATGRVTTVMTFAGPTPAAADQAVTCDPDVVYQLHVSNDDDLDDEFTIEVRLAADNLGNCFARVSGAPGMPAAGMPGSQMVVPAEIATTRGDVDVFVGLRDDPFFFDLQGFRETVAALDDVPQPVPPAGITMTNDRDFFENLNGSAIVVEFPLIAVSPSGQSFRVWGSTARIGS